VEYPVESTAVGTAVEPGEVNSPAIVQPTGVVTGVASIGDVAAVLTKVCKRKREQGNTWKAEKQDVYQRTHE
jgi:hypothetical protein